MNMADAHLPGFEQRQNAKANRVSQRTKRSVHLN